MKPLEQSRYGPGSQAARSAFDENLLDGGSFEGPDIEDKAPVWIGIGFLAGLIAMVSGMGLAIIVEWAAG